MKRLLSALTLTLSLVVPQFSASAAGFVPGTHRQWTDNYGVKYASIMFQDDWGARTMFIVECWSKNYQVVDQYGNILDSGNAAMDGMDALQGAQNLCR